MNPCDTTIRHSKRSLRRGVRQLLGVPEQESLLEFVEERGTHLRHHGERALRSLERVLRGLGIAPPAHETRTPPGLSPAAHVVRAEPTKFDLGQRATRVAAQEHIPWGYGRDSVTAMPVDPERLYVYWEVTDAGIDTARRGLGAGGEGAWLSLRVYDVTGRIFDGTNAHAYFDHRVERHDRQWFFSVGKPGSTVCIDVGMKSSEGYFVRIARSGRVDFPRSAPSPAGDVEWMSVRSATGEIESSHTSPAPPAHVAAAPASQVAIAPGVARPDAPRGARNGRPHGEQAASRGAGEADVAPRREIVPGTWHEVRLREEWLGDVERSSWEAGPFPYPVEPPRHEVLERRSGPASLVESVNGTHVVEEPWEVTIRGIGGRVERRVLARWEIVRTVPGEPYVEEAPLAEQVALGGSEQAVRRGASELRFGPGSELRLAGASEEFLVGASELRFRGASERRYAGASERRWLGGSERVAAAPGEWAQRGASEHRLGGASESRYGGASELVRSARESWQVFAEQGGRLAAAAPQSPALPPAGASEQRLGASERLVARAPEQASDAIPPAPPRW